MIFRLAANHEVETVRAFFARNLLRGNDAVYSEEFYCPFGVKAAIQRKQMFLVLVEGTIAAAARFYPKKNGEISLYQFAVEEEFRGQGIGREMLERLRGGRPVVTQCPANSGFNKYYEKTGWEITGEARGMTQWVLRSSGRDSSVALNTPHPNPKNLT